MVVGVGSEYYTRVSGQAWDLLTQLEELTSWRHTIVLVPVTTGILLLARSQKIKEFSRLFTIYWSHRKSFVVGTLSLMIDHATRE